MDKVKQPGENSFHSEQDLEEYIQKLILDSPMDKYKAVYMVRKWVLYLREQPANRHKTIYEVMSQAIVDVLEEKVSLKQIEKVSKSSDFEISSK